MICCKIGICNGFYHYFLYDKKFCTIESEVVTKLIELLLIPVDIEPLFGIRENLGKLGQHVDIFANFSYFFMLGLWMPQW